jgi:excisionase family DNA binding protein
MIMTGERLMSLAEVAELLGVPVSTLYRWRYLGEGPAGYRIGRHVRYRRAAVEAWLERQADEHRRAAGF